MTNSIKNNCSYGILSQNFASENLTILTEAIVSKGYRDLYFLGSFCPPHDGVYRLIFEGSFSSVTDVNSFYEFNNIRMKERTTPYHSLYSHTCYPYYIAQSIFYDANNNGK